MDAVNELCDLLQNHANRDKVVSLTSYVLKLWGATSGRAELTAASGRLAAARATLRLFDDAAALRNAAAYGLGLQEGGAWGALGVLNHASTLAYLQAEKVVWLVDAGLLPLTEPAAARARIAHKLFWSLASFLALIRSLKALHAAARAAQSPSRAKCAGARYSQAALASTKCLLDVAHSVSWLPRGWLWGARLPPARQAAVAAASAVLALILHYNAKKLASAK